MQQSEHTRCRRAVGTGHCAARYSLPHTCTQSDGVGQRGLLVREVRERKHRQGLGRTGVGPPLPPRWSQQSWGRGTGPASPDAIKHPYHKPARLVLRLSTASDLLGVRRRGSPTWTKATAGSETGVSGPLGSSGSHYK